MAQLYNILIIWLLILTLKWYIVKSNDKKETIQQKQHQFIFLENN